MTCSPFYHITLANPLGLSDVSGEGFCHMELIVDCFRCTDIGRDNENNSVNYPMSPFNIMQKVVLCSESF